MALTDADIIKRLVDDFDLTNREATDFLHTFITDIKHSIANGERVKLIGFGAIQLEDRKKVAKRRDLSTEGAATWKSPHFTTALKFRGRIQRSGRVEAARRADGTL